MYGKLIICIYIHILIYIYVVLRCCSVFRHTVTSPRSSPARFAGDPDGVLPQDDGTFVAKCMPDRRWWSLFTDKKGDVFVVKLQQIFCEKFLENICLEEPVGMLQATNSFVKFCKYNTIFIPQKDSKSGWPVFKTKFCLVVVGVLLQSGQGLAAIASDVCGRKLAVRCVVWEDLFVSQESLLNDLGWSPLSQS